MQIKTDVSGNKACVVMQGKLTVATSPDLETAVHELDESNGIVDYDIDLAGLEYISSAGLRILVATQKLASRKGGTMRLLYPNDDILDIFEMTGLSDVMTIVR